MCPAGAHLGNLSYLRNRRSSTPVRPPRDLSFLLTLATGLHCLPVATASVGCKYPFCGPELQQIASRRQDIFPASSTSVWGPLWSRSRWCCASSDVALLPLDLVLPLLHAFCGIASSQNLHDFCKGPDERRPLPPFILGRVPWARIPLLECVYVEQMLRRPARGCTALKATAFRPMALGLKWGLYVCHRREGHNRTARLDASLLQIMQGAAGLVCRMSIAPNIGTTRGPSRF